MFETKFKYDISYLIRYPENYKQGTKYPILFYFHGAGCRGDNIEYIKMNDIFTIINKKEDFPFIVIAPLCNEDTWFEMWERLKKLVLFEMESEYADKNRVYVTGLSMGGYATWQLAISLPTVFSAIIPICGGGMYCNTIRIKDVPVWAFHGGADDIVRPEESINMVNSLNAIGGNAKLTVIPDVGHHVWGKVYSEYPVFDWLLQFHK